MPLFIWFLHVIWGGLKFVAKLNRLLIILIQKSKKLLLAYSLTNYIKDSLFTSNFLFICWVKFRSCFSWLIVSTHYKHSMHFNTIQNNSTWFNIIQHTSTLLSTCWKYLVIFSSMIPHVSVWFSTFSIWFNIFHHNSTYFNNKYH